MPKCSYGGLLAARIPVFFNSRKKKQESRSARTVWTCCITCLGHLAALSHLISQTEPTLKGPMDKLCDLTLDRLRNLSHEAHIKEFKHFDVLTGVRRLVDPL